MFGSHFAVAVGNKQNRAVHEGVASEEEMTAEEWAGWNRDEWHRFRQCTHCGGAGKAPNVALTGERSESE